MTYIFFAIATHRSHLVLFKMEAPAPFYKDSGKGRSHDRILPVRLRLCLVALLCHERPNNESLYNIVPGSILSISQVFRSSDCRGSLKLGKEARSLGLTRVPTSPPIAGE